MTHYIVNCKTKEVVTKFDTYDEACEFLENQSSEFRCTHNMVGVKDEPR